MNNYKRLCIISGVALLLASSGTLIAQTKEVKDSTVTKVADRNVMLNASNNTGPRDVNIGLPAGTGGTTILENGLPVVYFYWPELPTKAWRQDATINGVKLLDVGQTAINVGDVGFSINTFDNLGTDDFKIKGSLNSNHFGLLRGDVNFSGPIGNKGTKFSLGAYTSFDPGTFKTQELSRYYADQAQLYKAGITQDYKIEGLRGSFTAFYKYANVIGMQYKNSPFIYDKDGKVREVDGFRIGRDSYYERSGRMMLKDAFTGEFVDRNILRDYGTESHTIDLISKNKLDNGLRLDFILRYHSTKSGTYNTAMTGAGAIDHDKEKFVYADNRNEEYTGSNVQGALVLASKRTPLRSVTSLLEIGKKSGKHEWTLGLNQWYMNTDRFATESAQYYQEIAANPRKLVKYTKDNAGNWITNANEYGDYGINNNMEYYNGNESKSAIFLLDKWSLSDVLTLNLGARLELNELNGDYQEKQPVDHLNAAKTPINHRWWIKSFMASATYKMTDKLGILGDVIYNEEGSHLNKYSSGKNPDIKKSTIPSASLGAFFNHNFVSVVSKVTYINRDQYRSTTNFSNPNKPGQVERAVASYEIETLGWTTDILAKPFKGFNLHLLLTVQAPKYKKFSGEVVFDKGLSSETTMQYDFSNKTVTGVPKILIEIDPSYTWKNMKVWGSARYFSKQYINKPNTLYLAGRWETFAGLNYKINKNLDANITVVNLLNQRGASGSMSDGDLITTAADADKKIGTVMSGSYIRPFTTEFGLKYRF